jgi:hypothetical protein
MLRRTVVLAACFTLASFSFAYAQGSEATDKGAFLISGAASFSSQGGDLFEDAGENRLTTIAIVPSVFYFVIPGLGIGADGTYNRQSQGDAALYTLGIGPKIGYFLDSGSNAIPYIAGGGGYATIGNGESYSGYYLKVGGGVMLRKDHLAIAFEAGYLYTSLDIEGDSYSGNAFTIGVGFAGFLY